MGAYFFLVFCFFVFFFIIIFLKKCDGDILEKKVIIVELQQFESLARDKVLRLKLWGKNANRWIVQWIKCNFPIKLYL